MRTRIHLYTVRTLCTSVFGIFACALGACATEENIVNYRPFFSGVAEAEHQTKPVGAGVAGQIRTEAKPAVEETESGEITLNSPSFRHMMSHVLRTLSDEDIDAGRGLFVEQVVSSSSADELVRFGSSAGAQYDLLRANYEHVHTLFSRLPMGEYTPTARMFKSGTRRIRVQVTGLGRKGLRWTSIEAEREGSEWKLVLPMR